MSRRRTSRRALMAALVGAGTLALPLFDTAGAQVDPPRTTCLVGGVPGPGDHNPGTSTTFTCSWTTSTSTAEETMDVDQHQTRVTAVREGTVVFDQTVNEPPASPDAQALAAQAAAALAGTGCNSTPLAVVESSRTPTGSTTANTTTVEGTESVESTIGNTGVTIQVGDRDAGGITFAVLPGTENFNFQTNYNIETLGTTTNTFLNAQHLETSGVCAGAATPAIADTHPVATPPVAIPVVAPPRTAG